MISFKTRTNPKDLIKVALVLIVFGTLMFTLHPLIFPPITFENEKHAIAELYSMGRSRGYHGRFHFLANGKVYFLHQNGLYNSSIIGEKFILGYEADNPEISRVYLSRPVFSEDEETISTEGRIKKLIPDKLVVFSYTISDREFEKWQKLEEGQNLNPKLQKGSCMPVSVSPKNLYRAIIHLADSTCN